MPLVVSRSTSKPSSLLNLTLFLSMRFASSFAELCVPLLFLYMDRVPVGYDSVKPPVGVLGATRSDSPDSPDVTCYSNDGSPSSDVFCDLEGKDTCCGAGWDCLANGLCRKSGTTSYAQGTCLNKAFDRCLSFCNQRTLLPSLLQRLIRFDTKLPSAISRIHRSEQLWTTGNQ